MSPEYIRYQLALKGIKQSQIANQLKVSTTLISRVISGEKKSRTTAKAIAKAIGQPLKEVFPSYVTQEAA